MSFASLFAVSPWLAFACVAVLGLVVGSFLNVLIVRLPRMMERAWRAQCAELGGSDGTDGACLPDAGAPYDLARPASHCQSCGHAIAWYQNIPVLSWLALRGRCAYCGAPIAWQYPAVEAGTALLFAACLAWLGPTHAAWAAMAFCAASLALAVIDIQTRLLPDELTLPLLWGGLLANLWGSFAPLSAAVVGAMAGYGVLWLAYWGYRLATGVEGMGHGDFKLMGAIGAWLGWQALPPVMLLSAAAGVAVALVQMLRGRMGRRDAMPFGPFLAAAGVAVMLSGDAWQRLLWGGAP